MHKLYKYNNNAMAHISTINDDVISNLSENKSLNEIYGFDNSAYIELKKEYSVLDKQEFNHLLINSIDNKSECISLLYTNLMYVDEESFLDKNFWMYLSTNFFHDFNFHLIKDNFKEKYLNNVLITKVDNKSLFKNNIAWLWYLGYFAYNTQYKQNIIPFLCRNETFFYKVFSSDLYFYKNFLSNFLEILYENEDKMISDDIISAKILKDFEKQSINKIIDFYSKEEILNQIEKYVII